MLFCWLMLDCWLMLRLVNADREFESNCLLPPLKVVALRSVVDPYCLATAANCLCVRPYDASSCLYFSLHDLISSFFTCSSLAQVQKSPKPTYLRLTPARSIRHLTYRFMSSCASSSAPILSLSPRVSSSELYTKGQITPQLATPKTSGLKNGNGP